MSNQGNTEECDIVLIAGLTPELLEKPALWWKNHETEIIRKRAINPYFSRNTFVIEKDAALKQSEFLRGLTDIGYQKTSGIIAKGTFLHKGFAIILFPINREKPIAIEFEGNRIDSIRPYTAIETDEEIIELRREEKQFRFREGDYVVHIDHGIGIFKTIEDNYFVVEYAPARKNGEPDRLFVPVAEEKRLSLYLGLRTPAIHRLGTPLWTHTKKKAKEDIIRFAKSLASLYKKRSSLMRLPYHPDAIEKEIWDVFPFEETADQKQALEDIFNDFSKQEPMERLLTGDVGFGKTEVALRAALRVILNGRQTAFVAPTTVLADQHAELFKKRFEKLPVRIERLTRLEPKKKIKDAREGAEKGTVDLVIGTHRLLQKDISFKNLGLLIIDEEQRFGVRHKEFLKEKYPSVDILSLSATPIPRTLAFSLAGVRPVSQLKEAPRGRRASLTYVLPYSKNIIKEAFLEEHKRDGQVYYLANRIQHIPRILETLHEIAPHMKKGIIHGRLHENEIIRVMHDFRKGMIDILVSTTIIENGLDISTVNTLIVEDASRLGLAQAHQLRGRIGRSDIQSYAYFFYPIKILNKTGTRIEANITKKAERRLALLEELSYLGAGIEIAKRDLEMRGAGNILGREQSGVANKIGWNLYFEMLGQAMEEEKSH
ncbi:MAG: DEAD/DEAH box helicase [Candidatus Niyogibacteria bacterium]|nr:DEAD/DEAH box helicase [Candidatus Niyogibacteria bacterium]